MAKTIPKKKKDLSWQQVKCSGCGREYQCTPFDDYYNDTDGTDGVCTKCLLKQNNLEGIPISTVIGGPIP